MSTPTLFDLDLLCALLKMAADLLVDKYSCYRSIPRFCRMLYCAVSPSALLNLSNSTRVMLSFEKNALDCY